MKPSEEMHWSLTINYNIISKIRQKHKNGPIVNRSTSLAYIILDEIWKLSEKMDSAITIYHTIISKFKKNHQKFQNDQIVKRIIN